jgi:hypothetical protein
VADDHPVALHDAWARLALLRIWAGDGAASRLRARCTRLASPVLATGIRHRDVGLLGVAVAVGATLRLFDLDRIGLNSDEAVYAGQSASLAGNPSFTDNFPVVRAHPLLFQLVASPFYRSGIPDVPGRYVGAAFGIATLLLVFVVGQQLYGARVGALAALLLAVVPYHVVVTRQELLDGPMTFFATGALACVAAMGSTGRGRWLVAAGGCLGLAALTKETAVILVAAVFAFLSLAPQFWRPFRHVVGGALLALALVVTYPVLTAVSGGARGGQSYLLWQLTRGPNHDFAFYFTAVATSMGPLLIAAALAGLVLLRRASSWRETLLVSWIVVPLVFFEVWPVKGFSYLLLLLPAVTVLAARALVPLLDGARAVAARGAGALVILVVLASLAVPAASAVLAPASSSLAGAGGTPGGREAGRWVAAHVPEGAKLMTIGPSMANIIQYYSGRPTDGLSVSPSPAHRNPSYRPILNPDAAVRYGDYQYIVWDAYSAQRSTHFAAKQQALIKKYHGVPVHTERARFDGRTQPVIVVYEVHP